MSLDYKNDGAFHEKLIEEVLSAYPDKFAKRRRKHLSVAKPAADTGEAAEDGGALTECAVKSNIKSLPGVMTIRGCAYAGSKGVVWGPVKDMVHISHGPVGCGQYSWSQRRNYYTGTTGVDTFVTMQFTSDFQERDIVFGGDKKLTKIIDEIETLFPLNRGITVQSECPIGLIGDDIEAVAEKKGKESRKTIVPVRCEGFRGVSQSLGHHIANDTIRDWVLDKKESNFAANPYDVNIIGDYNIGGDAWASRHLLEQIGLRVIASWSGDTSIAELERAPKAKMNLIHCYRSMNYICRHMEEKYGVAWMEYNFFGPTQIAASLRKIAKHFGPEIEEKAEQVIVANQPLVDKIIAKYRPRLEGKTVMLYVGGLRPRHIVTAYEDLGMKIVGAGYEFAHNDDYQRTGHYVREGTLIYDDITGYERTPSSSGSGRISSVPASRKSTRCRSSAFRSGRCTAGTTPGRITPMTASRSSLAIWTLRSTIRSGACSIRRGRRSKPRSWKPLNERSARAPALARRLSRREGFDPSSPREASGKPTGLTAGIVDHRIARSAAWRGCADRDRS